MPIRIHPGSVVTSLADGALVAVAPTGIVYRGNPTATAMWHALNHTTDDDLGDVSATIATCYDAPAADVHADLERFVGELHAIGLLEHRP